MSDLSQMNQGELEELLSAYLDGELDVAERQVVERIIAEDAQARRLVEELRETVRVIGELPRHAAPPSISQDVAAVMERGELLNGGEAGSAPLSASKWSNRLGVLSMAAGLALFVGAGFWMLSTVSIPAGIERVAARRADRPDDESYEAPIESGIRVNTGEADRPESGGASVRTSGLKAVSREHEEPREAVGIIASEAYSLKTADSRSGAFAPEQSRDGAAGERVGDFQAIASAEQKISAGANVNELQHHQFGNEQIRLRVTVQNEAESEEISESVRAYLHDQHVFDLSGTSAGFVSTDNAPPRFFLQGQEGVNFEGGPTQQILTRLFRRELDGLLEVLAKRADSAEEVVLAAGPLTVRGIGDVDRFLGNRGGYAYSGTAGGDSGTAESESTLPGYAERSGDDGNERRALADGALGAYLDVIEALGINAGQPETAKRMQEPAKADSLLQGQAPTAAEGRQAQGVVEADRLYGAEESAEHEAGQLNGLGPEHGGRPAGSSSVRPFTILQERPVIPEGSSGSQSAPNGVEKRTEQQAKRMGEATVQSGGSKELESRGTPADDRGSVYTTGLQAKPDSQDRQLTESAEGRPKEKATSLLERRLQAAQMAKTARDADSQASPGEKRVPRSGAQGSGGQRPLAAREMNGEGGELVTLVIEVALPDSRSPGEPIRPEQNQKRLPPDVQGTEKKARGADRGFRGDGAETTRKK